MSETLHATLSAAGILFFMVLIFWGAHYATKLVGRGTMHHQDKGCKLEILGRTMLGKEQALVIVRIGDTTLLLGVTGQQISKLDELDSAQFADIAPKTESQDFLHVLKDAWKQQKQTSGEEDTHP